MRAPGSPKTNDDGFPLIIYISSIKGALVYIENIYGWEIIGIVCLLSGYNKV
jgi:hypothetical protein